MYEHVFFQQDISEATKTLASSNGLSTILHFEMNHDEGKYGKIGIKKMILTFKNETDFASLTIGKQHAGRLSAPEIIDSTYKVKRYWLLTMYDVYKHKWYNQVSSGFKNSNLVKLFDLTKLVSWVFFSYQQFLSFIIGYHLALKTVI